MQYEYIQTDQDLRTFCDSLADVPSICFDTEFVSEDTYLPELCLIQVAAGDQLAVIDPQPIEDLRPFWRVLADGQHETIAHSAREEFRFCRQAIDQRPARLFDIQIAAGLAGLEYPASYGKLISKLLGETLPKGETRTDWRRRPLTDRQIHYALQDVLYLQPLRDKLVGQLQQLGRLGWMAEEMEAWQQNLVDAETRERWRRVSGISGLSEKALVIVRELWRWREAEAQRQNRPPKRLLRDDLMVELARRGTADLKRIRAIRGIERTSARRHLAEIAQHIERALTLPRSEWPSTRITRPAPQANVLGQFLTTALNCICQSKSIAPNLVGTVQDVRDLITWHLDPASMGEEGLPALAQGWRAEIVGRTIEDLLSGKMAIRITDPEADQPLSFESTTAPGGSS